MKEEKSDSEFMDVERRGRKPGFSGPGGDEYGPERASVACVGGAFKFSLNPRTIETVPGHSFAAPS